MQWAKVKAAVQLTIGEEVLLAHITQKSALQLQLQPGMALFAQVKGTSIIR